MHVREALGIVELADELVPCKGLVGGVDEAAVEQAAALGVAGADQDSAASQLAQGVDELGTVGNDHVAGHGQLSRRGFTKAAVA